MDTRDILNQRDVKRIFDGPDIPLIQTILTGMSSSVRYEFLHGASDGRSSCKLYRSQDDYIYKFSEMK